MAEEKFPDAFIVKEELLSVYPPKVARKRSKQIVVKESGAGSEIMANVRTIPGIITQRGCSYAGCKGVVFGPTRDIVNITHGPIGCGFYSWLTRRNQTRVSNSGDANYIPYCFSTDMQEEQIVFGGEKKLKQACQEAYDLFKPEAICIFATCPVGLIGDDIHAVSREMSKKLGINVFGCSCEGYKGVSQSAGHHIANNTLFKHIVGLNDETPEGKYKINLLGEYNIGGDAFVLEDLFEKCGLTLVSTFSGNSTYEKFTRAHTADLNLVMCHRSINYIAQMMETKYGIPWFKINLTGARSTVKALRKIAQFFDDKELTGKVEEVIARELKEVRKAQEEIRPRLEGKTAMLFVGGSRAHHYQELFREVGMKIVGAGYEFAHRDDYEGRDVLPDIKVDADSRNIEELKVEKDPTRYKPRKSEKEINQLAERGLKFRDYDGLMPDMGNNSLTVDDLNHHEQEKLLEMYKPSIFCAGIKEKYGVQKNGIPCKQLHSYDYGGPYAGFKGAINFYYEIDRMINTNVWSFIEAPWQKEPQLTADYASA